MSRQRFQNKDAGRSPITRTTMREQFKKWLQKIILCHVNSKITWKMLLHIRLFLKGGLTVPLPSASTISAFRDRKHIHGASFLETTFFHKGARGLLRCSLHVPGLCWVCYNSLLADAPSCPHHRSNTLQEKGDGTHPHLSPLWIRAWVTSDTWTRDLRSPPKSACKNTMQPATASSQRGMGMPFCSELGQLGVLPVRGGCRAVSSLWSPLPWPLETPSACSQESVESRQGTWRVICLHPLPQVAVSPGTLSWSPWRSNTATKHAHKCLRTSAIHP